MSYAYDDSLDVRAGYTEFGKADDFDKQGRMDLVMVKSFPFEDVNAKIKLAYRYNIDDQFTDDKHEIFTELTLGFF